MSGSGSTGGSSKSSSNNSGMSGVDSGIPSQVTSAAMKGKGNVMLVKTVRETVEKYKMVGGKWKKTSDVPGSSSAMSSKSSAAPSASRSASGAASSSRSASGAASSSRSASGAASSPKSPSRGASGSGSSANSVSYSKESGEMKSNVSDHGSPITRHSVTADRSDTDDPSSQNRDDGSVNQVASGKMRSADAEAAAKKRKFLQTTTTTKTIKRHKKGEGPKENTVDEVVKWETDPKTGKKIKIIETTYTKVKSDRGPVASSASASASGSRHGASGSGSRPGSGTNRKFRINMGLPREGSKMEDDTSNSVDSSSPTK